MNNISNQEPLDRVDRLIAERKQQSIKEKFQETIKKNRKKRNVEQKKRNLRELKSKLKKEAEERERKKFEKWIACKKREDYCNTFIRILQDIKLDEKLPSVKEYRNKYSVKQTDIKKYNTALREFGFKYS